MLDFLDVPFRLLISIAAGFFVGFVTYSLGYPGLAPHLGAGTSIALLLFLALRDFRSDRSRK